MPEAQTQAVAQTTAGTMVAASRSKGLVARAFGVIFSPRATYAAVASRPRALGALIVVVAISVALTSAFLATEVGKNAYIDQSLSMMDGLGRQLNDQQMAGLERVAEISSYVTAAAQVVVIPLFAAMIAGLSLAIFNALLGGDATFKQAFAIVVHSYFIVVLSVLFSMPLFYARESMASTTSLVVFFPMVDEATFAGRLMGAIDLFRIWWLVSLAIGMGVLYKRKTGPIAWSFLGIYFVVVLIFAGIRTALAGA